MRGRVSRAVVVVLVGTLAAVVAGAAIALDARNDVEARLDERADRVAALLELQLERYADASRALASLRATDPDQERWQADLGLLGIGRSLPSVFNVASTTLVDPADVPMFERAQSTPAIDFSVFPPVNARDQRPDELLVIDRVHPLAANRGALGFDILVNPAAAVAAQRSIDGGVVSMSDALTLVQEPGDQAGLAIYSPWYDDLGRVAGATDLVLRGQDLLDSLVDELGDVGLTVLDETPDGDRTIGTLVPEAGNDEGLVANRTINPLGQSWEVAVTAPVGFASTTERTGGVLTFLGIFALTALVATIVHLLQQSEERARTEVAERTRELVAANRELASSLATKDEFLTVIGHEFRTPIAVIRGFAETAVAGRAGTVSPEVSMMLERIDRQADRLNVLVDNVVIAAQVHRGELRVAPETIDMSQLVGAVVARHDLEQLTVDAEPGLLVTIDPAHAVKALDAVLDNAGKYGAPPIEVTATSADTHAVVRIQDHGTGVCPELADRVFERFAQADAGSTRRSRGVGLGLAVVRTLCEGMGGSARLVADAGPGACFELRFPLATDGARARKVEDIAAVASPVLPTDGD